MLTRLKSHNTLNNVFITFFVRAGGVVAAFLLQLVVARTLGASGAGLVFLAMTTAMGLSVVARFGLDNSLMRFVGPEWDSGNYGKVKGILIQAVIVSFTISIILSLVLNNFSLEFSEDVFSEPAMEPVLVWMGFALIPFALIRVFSGGLKAVKMPATANYFESGAISIFTVVFIFITMQFETSTAEGVARSYFFGAVVSMCIAAAILWQRTRSPLAVVTMPTAELGKSAQTLMLVALFNYINIQSSIFLLGIWAEPYDVGLYSVAYKVATLLAFILSVVNSIAAPRFATHFKTGSLDLVEAVAVKSAAAMFIFITPLLLLILLIPDLILSLFGQEFVHASNTLVIIALGQTVNVLTGSVGFLLMMSGHERILRNMTFISGILTLILNVTLIPPYGANGAAIATAVCLAFNNLMAAWWVYKRLGIRTIPTISNMMELIRN